MKRVFAASSVAARSHRAPSKTTSPPGAAVSRTRSELQNQAEAVPSIPDVQGHYFRELQTKFESENRWFSRLEQCLEIAGSESTARLRFGIEVAKGVFDASQLISGCVHAAMAGTVLSDATAAVSREIIGMHAHSAELLQRAGQRSIVPVDFIRDLTVSRCKSAVVLLTSSDPVCSDKVRSLQVGSLRASIVALTCNAILWAATVRLRQSSDDAVGTCTMRVRDAA